MSDKKSFLTVQSQRGIIRIPPPQAQSTQQIKKTATQPKVVSSQSKPLAPTNQLSKSEDFDIEATLALFEEEKKPPKKVVIPTPISVNQRKSNEKTTTPVTTPHKVISIPRPNINHANSQHQVIQIPSKHTQQPSAPTPKTTPVKISTQKPEVLSQKTVVIAKPPQETVQQITHNKTIPMEEVDSKPTEVKSLLSDASSSTVILTRPSVSSGLNNPSNVVAPVKSSLHEKGGRVGTTNAVFTGEGKDEIHISFSSNKFSDVREHFKENNIHFELLGKDKKEMKISYKDYATAYEICKQRPLLQCEAITKCVKELLSETKEDDGDLNRYETIPAKLRNTMFEYQRVGVKFALKKKGRVLIGDEMGLGKTLQALALIAAYPENNHVLVIVPNSLVYQWCDQIQRWLDVDPNDIAIYRPKDLEVPNTRFVVISYNSMANTQGNMFSHSFPMVVCDECHFIKSDTSKRTKETLDVCRKAKQIIFLSGTPALSRPMELFNILSILIKDIGNKEAFGRRYCEEAGSRFKNYTSMKNERELKFILNSVMIRRLKDEVLKELPPKIREKVYLGELDKKEYRQCLEKMKKDLDNSKGGQRKKQVFELHRSTGLAKIPLIQAYIDDVLDSGVKKFIVFAHHKDVIDGIIYNLQSKKVPFIKIDGDTKQEDRKQCVDCFKSDENFRVAVLSILAANCGLEFQSASLCIFAEMTFVPGEMLQAEDRIHRIGQEADSVRIEYLIANKSYDEQIWNMIEKKLDVVGKVLDGKSRELKHGTKEAEIDEKEMGDFIKGMLEVIKSYDERKRLREDEELRIEKRRIGIEDAPQPKNIQNEIDLLDDIGDNVSCSNSLSKFGKFQFEKK